MIIYRIKKFEDLSAIEIYDLLQLRADVFVIEQACIYQDCDNKDKVAIHLLGYEGETLVTYSRLLDQGISYPNYCSIGRVVTHSSYRKLKLGKELMLKSIEYCLQHFKAPIKISGQAYLEKFYNELGFETVSEPYMEDDIPHLGMVYKKSSLTL